MKLSDDRSLQVDRPDQCRRNFSRKTPILRFAWYCHQWAMEMAVQRDDTNYSLGGSEYVIASSDNNRRRNKNTTWIDRWVSRYSYRIAGGVQILRDFVPFLHDKLTERKRIWKYRRWTGFMPLWRRASLNMISATSGNDPLLKMYTLTWIYSPKIHAGGLRYHGMAPTISHL